MIHLYKVKRIKKMVFEVSIYKKWTFPNPKDCTYCKGTGRGDSDYGEIGVYVCSLCPAGIRKNV